MARGDLTEEQWKRLEPLLPTDYRLQRRKLRRKPGRAWKDHRSVLNGILWVLRTGAPWADLPDRYGPHQTCWDRFARWQRDGTWDRILAALQTDAEDRGMIKWSNCSLDGSYVRVHQQAAGARRQPSAEAAREGGDPKGGGKEAISAERRGRPRL
jgi:transposase